MAEAKKRKGTALLAVMNESCSSCAGSPICEAHCPVDDCINLLYEELPGGIFYEYANRFYDANRKPVPPDAVPKRFQLQLIGTESEDRLDKKICPWDAIKMYEFDDGLVMSEYFYDKTKIKEVNGQYVIDSEEKARLEEKQSELYE